MMPSLPHKLLKPPPIFIGIDPGKSGGFVALLPRRNIILLPMPETELELWKSLEYLKEFNFPMYGVIERVHAMPKQGVTSMFTFGQGYGSCRMALTAAGVSWEDIPPQSWMKEMNFPFRKGEAKAKRKLRLKQLAQQLYPNLPIWNELKSKGKQLAITDALLIATYCQRRHRGIE